MAALVCDLCGGKLVMSSGGIAICDSCGMHYNPDRLKEKVQEIKGTVRVDNTHMVQTYLEMAKTALDAGNYAETESYANKVIEIYPHTAKAWLYKGIAAGCQTTGRNNRYPESIVNWINACTYSTDDERDNIKTLIVINAMNIGEAILQLKCDFFSNIRDEDNEEEIYEAIEMLNEQLDLLKKKTGINVYTGEFETLLAQTIYYAVVSASQKVDKEFGPEKEDMDQYHWECYTDEQDLCLSLLTKAYELCHEDYICHTICNDYIKIAEAVRDSCSYTYEDDEYVQDYSFTNSAKAIRTKKIDSWKLRRDSHDLDKRKENCQTAIDIYVSACIDTNKRLAIKQYWKSHANERASLENELAEIEAQKACLELAKENDPDKIRLKEIDNEILSTQDKIATLGLFKGKEKKALTAKIAELTAQKKILEERCYNTIVQLDEQSKKLNERANEIAQEFSKDREIIISTPIQRINLFSNGHGTVSAMDLVSYYEETLPNGYTVRGAGEDAIEDYLCSIEDSFSALFASLAGKDSAPNEKSASCSADSDSSKIYKIHFDSATNPETSVAASFSSKSIYEPIGDSLSYTLKRDESIVPDSVADFLQIVISSTVGMCPSLDVERLTKSISAAAYGIDGETIIEYSNLIFTVTGGTKNDLRFVITPNTKS